MPFSGTPILYVARGASQTTSNLYTVDTATGVCTSVGSIPYALTGLAFDPTDDGALYGVATGSSSSHPRGLIRVDPATGAGTFIALVGGIGLICSDISFDSTGQMFGIFPGAATHLKKIDKATGAVTEVGDTGSGHGSGNAFAIDRSSSDLAYFASSDNLSNIDLTTAALSSIAFMSGDAGSNNAFDCDADGTLWLLGTGFDSRVYTVITSGGFAGDCTTVCTLSVDSMDAMAWYLPPAPPPPSVSSFYQGYQWRFIVTNLQLDVLSWMQGLMTNRRILLTANQAAVIDTDVFPDDFLVNGLVFDPGSTTKVFPRLAQSNRIIFAYRREGDSSIEGVTPWQCKAAGIIMSLEDQADTDVPLSHVTAYDPWKLLEARPAMNALGELPGQLGFLNTGPGSTTALQYLKDTIENEGGVYIDAGVSWGGTSSYGSAGGVLETTPDVVMTVQQGQSVADVWNALVDGGNMDIKLIPIYDPTRQIVGGDGTVYYFTHELSILNVAGSQKPNALMGWDKLNHCINRIDRMHDATPGAFFDKVQYFAGQGGVPVPLTPLVDAANVAEYGSYWSQQFFPSLLSADPTGSMTYALAVLALRLVKQGRRTLTLDLSSGLGPIPLIDYDLFDLVPVHASEKLRVTVDGYLKVEAIPITIDDNGVESVNGLVTSPDYRTVSYP